MSTPFETLCLDLLGLPATSRALLAAKLLSSLDEEEDPDAEKAWIEEVARRVREVEEGKVQMLPLDEALREARARLK